MLTLLAFMFAVALLIWITMLFEALILGVISPIAVGAFKHSL